MEVTHTLEALKPTYFLSNPFAAVRALHYTPDSLLIKKGLLHYGLKKINNYKFLNKRATHVYSPSMPISNPFTFSFNINIISNVPI